MERKDDRQGAGGVYGSYRRSSRFSLDDLTIEDSPSVDGAGTTSAVAMDAW